MTADTFTIPLPSGPCPPADSPEAILLWLYWKHLDAGRIEKRREHTDPFWRCIDEKRAERLRLALSLEADPEWERQVGRMAEVFGLELAGKDKDAQIDSVVGALVPMRFHLSGALEELGELERAAEVLGAAY